jgi:hypothetical protein
MNFLSRLRMTVAPLCALTILACGSTTDTFGVDEDTGIPGSDTSVATDGSGTDTSGTDTSGTDGAGGKDTSGTDAIGTDATGSDVIGSDATGTDTAPPPSDTSTCTGTVCGGVCTDTKTDPLNCGACGKVVCHNEACADGKRVCAPGTTACGGSGSCLGCKNLRSDPTNCGTCGKTCSIGSTCLPPPGGGASSCQIVAAGCPAGLTPCPSAAVPSACVNTTRDITNCGGCGVNCSPGEYCVDSACVKYVSAPGCTTCPCAACAAPTDKCCRYTDGTVCSSKCPAG